MSSPHDPSDAIPDELGSLTIALRIMAGLMVVGALYLMGALLVPFVLAIILAIALSPVASRLERAGVARGPASLICMLAVATVLALTVGLVGYQAGGMVRDSDRYFSRFSQLLADTLQQVGGDKLMESLGVLRKVEPTPRRSGAPNRSEDHASAEAASRSDRPDGVPTDPVRYWDNTLRQNARALGRWVVTGIGGMLGCLGGAVVLFAFLFYMLRTRAEWVDRVTLALGRLGLRPRGGELTKVQHEIVTYIGCLALVSLGYTIIVTLCLWAIGVPQPLLWGLLAGLLELVPYFGPLIAAVLPMIVALSLPQWWQPALVFGMFVGLHTMDGYVITPQLYGKAIKIDPVSLLFGILFFGWLWGPLGLAAAMPVMILLRGLVAISPDTPALDALVDEDGPNAKLGVK